MRCCLDTDSIFHWHRDLFLKTYNDKNWLHNKEGLGEQGGGGHEREKVEQNEAWKSLLPSIAPGWTHPPRLWQYWHQGEPTKSFLVVVCGQYFRKYGKIVIKKPFRFSFIFKTVESLGGETGGRSWSWNWAGGGAQVCGFDYLICLCFKLVYLFIHFINYSIYFVLNHVLQRASLFIHFILILFWIMFYREREGLAGENTRLRHRQLSVLHQNVCNYVDDCLSLKWWIWFKVLMSQLRVAFLEEHTRELQAGLKGVRDRWSDVDDVDDGSQGGQSID